MGDKKFKTLSDEIEFVHDYEIKGSRAEVHLACIEEVIIVSKVKKSIKKLKESRICRYANDMDILKEIFGDDLI